MASKEFSTGTTSNGFTLKLTLTEGTPDVTNNRTPVTYALVLYNGGYNFSGYQIGYSVLLNGSGVASVDKSSAPVRSMMSDYSSLELCSGTTYITHNDDGSKSFPVAFSINMNSASYTPGPMSGSGTMDLTPIARASVPTLSATSFNMGSTITIYTNRKSTSFVHIPVLFASDGVTKLFNITPAATVGDKYEWDTSALFPYCKASVRFNGIIRLVTYIFGGAEVGKKDVPFTATVPNTTAFQPSVSMTLSAPPTSVGELSGLTEYVQSNFKLTATISATPKKSAGMAKYVLNVGGSSKSLTSTATSDSITSDTIHKSGDVSVSVTGTDTRGFNGVASNTINVTPYGKPFITTHPSYSSIQCFRWDAEKNVKSDSGTALKFIFKSSWYSLKSGANKLKGYIRIKSNNSDSGDIDLTAAEEFGGGASYGYISWYSWDDVFTKYSLDPKKSYTVTFTFVDSIGVWSAPLEFTIPSEKVDLHLGGNKVGIGEYAEDKNTVSVAEDWKLKVKGDVEIKGALVADHIVESGTSGIWMYEKLNSGICKLYANIYFVPESTGYIHKTYAYPFTLKSAPIININITRNMSVCKEIYPSNSGGNYTSEYTLLDVSFYDVTTTNYAIYASVQVVSRWK